MLPDGWVGIIFNGRGHQGTQRGNMSKTVMFTKRETIKLVVAVWLGLICFIISLFSPVMTISTAVVFSTTYTLADGILELFEHGDWLLMGIILLFSVLIPFGKFLLLLRIIHRQQIGSGLHKLVERIHTYSRWAMFDVFLVAVLVSSVKIGQLANVEMEYGVYLFLSAIFLTTYVTASVTRSAETMPP
jgi:paraquat-inducible protein A